MKITPYVLTTVLAVLPIASLRADDALLNPAVTVKIPSSKGKFDFLEVDALNHRLLAAHEKAGTADFIDLNSNTLITRVDTGPAVSICLDPKIGKYFISASEDKKVVVVDSTTLKKVGEIPTDGELDAILYEPNNDRVYVTNDESTHVWAIDPNTMKVVDTIDIDGPPEYMLYDSVTDKIYLNLKKANAIATIDPSTNKIIATFSTLPAESPHGLGFDPKTGRLFPAGQNGVVAEIDAKTGKVIGSASISKGVDQAVFDPYTRRIYCACGGTISIVKETDDGIVSVGSISAPITAKNVAIDPTNHSVWTTYTEGDDSFATSWLP